MNSISERKYSLDELKQMNSRDLSTASEGERHITLTDRNWTAVLNLLSRLCEMLELVMATLASLLTKPDAEELLKQIDRNTQTQLRNLNTEIRSFAQQAGSLNERFSSTAGKITSNAEKELASLTRSTKDSLDTIQSKTDSRLEELRRWTAHWLKAMGAVCIVAVMTLTILYAIFILRRLG